MELVLRAMRRLRLAAPTSTGSRADQGSLATPGPRHLIELGGAGARGFLARPMREMVRVDRIIEPMIVSYPSSI